MDRHRKMKRFIKVYLTLFVVAIITTNLVLVLIYGQQFLFSAASDEVGQDAVLNNTVFIINAVVVAVFAIFWAIANYYYKQSTREVSDSNKQW